MPPLRGYEHALWPMGKGLEMGLPIAIWFHAEDAAEIIRTVDVGSDSVTPRLPSEDRLVAETTEEYFCLYRFQPEFIS